MTRPLGKELELAQNIQAQAGELSADLAFAGQAWLAPGQQVKALRREGFIRERIKVMQILLDTIEQGLT
jgi:hypothetical protein